MSDEPRKRSRFDQTEPEPARKSRFDRRSRSPAPKDVEAGRSRSPVSKSTERPSSSGGGSSGSKAADATAAAAAVAARINASINAKKGIQHVDVPPIRANASPANADAAKSPTDGGAKETYTQDGDFIQDIEVNDIRNRYTLTKGSTQKMIKEKTGADVTTRGNYYPDKSLATAANPPLYLHVTSQTKDGLDRAIEEINELMKQELPNLIDERRFRRREPDPVERDSLGRRKWPEERIPIDLEPIPGFNLRAQVVGAGGSFVKHIQQETGCRVQIKGRGSGFMEHDTQRESDEQMYLHVAGPDANNVQQAKGLCLELLETVKASYEEFKERGPRGGSNRGGGYDDNRGGGYHQRDRNGSGSYGGGGGNQYGGNGQYGGQDQYGANNQYGYGQQHQPLPIGYDPQQAQVSYPTAQSPVTAPVHGQPQQQTDMTAMSQWIQFYQENPQLDPYAAYGGYAAMIYNHYSSGPGAAQQAGLTAGSPTGQQMQSGYGQGQAYGYGYGGSPGTQQGQGWRPPPQLDGQEDEEAPPPPPPPPS